MAGQRVVIVGGGLLGLSIARALTARGVDDVLVLERATLASGGTGKSSGIVRCHYGVPSIAAMSWRSLPTFEELGDVVGFRQVGYLVGVGAENSAPLRANTEVHQRLGIEVEMIDHDRVAGLWPYLRVDDFAAFSYEPRGGYADASQLATHFGAQARSGGARIRQSTPVTRVLTAGEAVTGVELAGGEVVEADVVVVATGLWSGELMSALRIDFPVQSLRSELLVVDAGEPLRDLPVLSDLVSLQYVRVEGSGELLVGNSDHSEPKFADPDNYSNQASEAGLERAGAKVLHRFDKFPEVSVAHTYAGCYDITPDWNPVIAPVGFGGLYLAAGFSGHGFKISPAVGTLMADLILEGDSTDPDIPAADFRLERFAEGRPLLSRHPYAGAGEMR
ncbi:FAD-binding oxidoreductase [Frankia sp. CNm7]|uniref:FAD-binding oxidoreductase n=1 Tax=Frankia nepalensis TaxID=1836974 RepID=A0A937RDU4_9ACTN|nr:FAD-dependent oxidoreductase [Frankia nepalensis]MBL7500616.1 FAD-binding oxidoreductase [Frankia nepalensis]MBL7510983.1 FAD-binding oxidoreductase [Frankia nepalensis]MBL7519834.1 FAD-binding oxidoreductase [Frankia nepalensis]MBL7630288.1 FAD-binding oxidoreductase [Frankia nepalensis]